MASLSNRIRELREEKGLSMRALAAQLGMDHGYLGRMERGDSDLSLERMRRIARALSVGVTDLLLPEDHASPVAGGAPETRIHGFERADPAAPYKAPYPIELWGDQAGWSPHGCIYFDRDYLSKFNVNPLHCTMIRVLDSSMSPKLPLGSLCMVDQARRDLAHGAPFAFQYQSAPIIRRLKRSGPSWILAADDPDHEFLPLSDDMELIGETVWFCALIPEASLALTNTETVAA